MPAWWTNSLINDAAAEYWTLIKGSAPHSVQQHKQLRWRRHKHTFSQNATTPDAEREFICPYYFSCLALTADYHYNPAKNNNNSVLLWRRSNKNLTKHKLEDHQMTKQLAGSKWMFVADVRCLQQMLTNSSITRWSGNLKSHSSYVF